MYRVLVLKNRIDVDITDDCAKAVAYFAKHNINISFDFKDVDQKVSTHMYKKAYDGVEYHGVDDYVKDDCAKITPQGEYRALIFAWNTKDVPQPVNGSLTSWTNYGALSYNHLDTAFIQLITNDFNDKTDWVYLSLIHELMHAFCANLSRFRVIDEMDRTQDGKDYLFNNQPDHPDGNFARTLKNIEPFKDKIYEFYYFDLKNNQPLKLGDKGERVKQLQRDLKALGYFKYPFITGTFGSITKASVRAFQRARGLVADGIAGSKTLAELKKKPKVDFGLLPELQAKADLLIDMCKMIGYDIRITEGYRTQERQNKLYASGRTEPGLILTNAKKSKHTERKAFDYCFVGKEPYPKDNGQYKKIADIAKSIGLTPGYYFKKFRDAVHMEI